MIRRWAVSAMIALAACGGGGGGGDGDAATAPTTSGADVEAVMNAACGKPSYRGCHVAYETVGDAQTITLQPNATDAGARVLVAWGLATGCLEDIDFARIDQTRALDGMVQSRNGRSTWTYHPDDGLTVVCAP